MKLNFVTRKKLFFFIVIPAVAILLLFLLNLFVRNKIKDRLQELDSQISYEDLDVNIYFNRYSLEEVKTQQDLFSLGAKKVIFKGISYSGFLFDNELQLDKLEMQEPQITYFTGVQQDGKKKAGERQVKIGEIVLSNGNFSSKENDTAATTLFLKFPQVKLKPGKNFSSLNFDSYQIAVDSAYVKMNEEHYIDVGSAEAEDGEVRITDFRIASFYPKNEFDRKIPYEKDRIDLKVPHISLQDLQIKKVNDTLHIKDSKIQISEAFLEIYRNKLVADDTRRKPLYNEMLRNAPVKLNLKQVFVEKSEIIYEELVQEDRPAAVIRFTQVDGEIENLQNISDSLPQPQVTANAHFMRGTPVSLTWSFPVFDYLNQFEVSGEFGKINGEALDPFLVPAMDVRARGQIYKILFNFYGNDDLLKGDYAMDYDKLKVVILKDEGTEKKNILSALANLLVENEGEAGFQEKEISVERNKQRSYWNYLWLGLREGFIDIVKQL